MRLAYLEATFGLSGDKMLAALLDAGADLDGLNGALGSLGIGVSVETEVATAGPIAARRARVVAAEDQPQRAWSEIETLMAESPLDEAVSERSREVFERLARAEATVHGIEPADVHFHEVGAADSIGDIIGCVWCLRDLGIEYLACSEIVTGSGTVEAQHGTLPVPAPATAVLLQGIPTRGGREPSEMTTPTGAVLAATLASSFGPPPAMTVTAIGTGAGTRETREPNVCRIFVGEAESAEALAAGIESQVVVLLAATLDDITPEHLAFASDELLSAGALDVWRTAVSMKKGRLGTTIEVLALPEDATRLSDLTMRLTGSPGTRLSALARRIADREIIEVDSEWGPARVKVLRLPGRVVTHAEYDDCARIAREHGLAPEDVARSLEELVRAQTPAQER
jgi:uncharacterized protein (TIGR00299 family) protein